MAPLPAGCLPAGTSAPVRRPSGRYPSAFPRDNHGEGSTTADWQLSETNVVSIGTVGTSNKIHDLTLSIHNLVGSQITVRLHKAVNGTEQEVYEQNFDAATDPPGLPVINGSWAMHGILRVTLQSNDVADNGKTVDYDYMLEAI